jgi:hypothetical protein
MITTDVIVPNASEMRELTPDELGEAAGGMFPPGPTAVSPDILVVTGLKTDPTR